MADYTTWTDSALAAQRSYDENLILIQAQIYNDCVVRSSSTGENCSGPSAAYETTRQQIIDISNEQYRRSTSPPSSAPPPATGGGTPPPSAGGGPITVNVAAPTVNFDTASLKAAIDNFNLHFSVEGIQAVYQLIDTVKGISAGGPSLSGIETLLKNEHGLGIADVLEDVSFSLAGLQEIFKALAPIGAAFTEESDPKVLTWAKVLATWGAAEKARVFKDGAPDLIRFIWDEVGKLAGEVRGPFTEVLKGLMEVVHAPGKEVGGVMADLIMNETIEGVKLVSGSTIASASKNASQLWRTMYGLGMSAHLFAEAGELMHPFKELGLPQAAAFAVDMAGFGRVGASIIGALTDAGVRIPMHYAALREAQPEIPGFRQLATMFRRGAIDEAKARDSLQYHGFNKDYSDAFIESWYRAPSLYELSVLLQDSDADSSVLHDMLIKNGYRPEAADNMLTGLEKKVVAPGRTKVVDAALALYEKGLMTDAELSGELSQQNLRPEMIDLLTQAGTLRGRAIIVADATTEFVTMFTNGILEEGDLRTSLAALGYSQQRVDILVGIQVAKQKGKITEKEAAATAKIKSEFQRESIALYREQFDAGLMDAGSYQAALVAIGIDNAVAVAIVGIDVLKVSQRTQTIKTAQAQALHNKIVEETRAALQDQYRKGLITIPQLSAGLSQLGLDAQIVSAVTAQEQALAQPKPNILIDPPPAILLQVTTERLRAAVIVEFKKGIIDEARAKSELVASGENSGLADQDLRLAAAQSHRTPKAATETPEEKQLRTIKKEAAIVEYHAGAITEDDLLVELVDAGYSEALSDALVSLEFAKKTAKEFAAAEKAAAAPVKKPAP